MPHVPAADRSVIIALERHKARTRADAMAWAHLGAQHAAADLLKQAALLGCAARILRVSSNGGAR